MTLRQRNQEFILQFENMFKLHFKSLCYYAMSFTRDDEVARDIVHDVFMGIWDHRLDIDFEKPIYPYLVSLTRNRTLNYLEHLKVEGKHISRQQALGEFYETANDGGYEELVGRIMGRMEQLPERCREVMYLCFVECKKHKEIAEELNISITTVRTHIAIGLKLLRKDFPNINLLFVLTCFGSNVKK